MTYVRYLTTTVEGQEVFYREAGRREAPSVVLLHGFPTSSHMFRELIPLLADRYHVIAPDHIGFGSSSAPPPEDFDYTFEHLASVTAALLEQLGVERFAIYVQDYGAPIGWRLALAAPERVAGIITQNGNAYEEGLVPGFWDGLFAYASDPTAEAEAEIRKALTPEITRWQYVNGVEDPALVSPDAWMHAQAILDRDGSDAIQLALFRDYPNNVALYPTVHEYFRTSQVPLLAVWGANDEIFGPDGARAFLRHLPDADVHFVPSGHFALESHLDAITGHIRGFLAAALPDQPATPTGSRA